MINKVREVRETRKRGQQTIIIGHLMLENQKKGMVSVFLSSISSVCCKLF
jgi:hypothetical protein